jgi:hypothetical protein
LPSLSYGNDLLQALNHTMRKSDYNVTDLLIFQKSLANINIYYENLSYDVLTESPSLTFLNFILNIGYTFGLFFGNFKKFKILFCTINLANNKKFYL